MAWDVRPTTDLEEFKRRRRRDLALLRRRPRTTSAPSGSRACCRSSGCTPPSTATAIVGGAGAFPFQLTVPGGSFRCGGVTVVGVLPTHRRRGVLTAMMRAQLEDIRERGEPIAALWASEEVIYRPLRLRHGVDRRRDGAAERLHRAARSRPTSQRARV